MKITIFCQFEEDTANGILMKGRAQAFSDMMHKVDLIYQPFKYKSKMKSFKKEIAVNFLQRNIYSAVFRSSTLTKLFFLCFFLIFDSTKIYLIMRRADVVILHKALPLSLYYLLLLKISFYNGKSICIVDDWEGIGGFASIRNSNNFVNRMIVTFSEELTPLLSNGIHCVSKILYEKMMLSSKTSYKSIYMPNGGSVIEPEENNNSDKFTVGYIGTFKSIILVNFLIKTIVKVNEKSPNIFFLVVGGGNQFEYFYKKSKEFGLNSRVELTGQVPLSQVNFYIKKMNVCLLYLNDKYPETFIDASRSSTKLFEYMAWGKIIVSSNFGEPTNILKNNYTGFLVKNIPEAFADKLVEIEKKYDFVKNIGDSARKIFNEKYSHNILMKNLLNWIINL